MQQMQVDESHTQINNQQATYLRASETETPRWDALDSPSYSQSCTDSYCESNNPVRTGRTNPCKAAWTSSREPLKPPPTAAS